MASLDSDTPTTSLPYTCNTCLVAFRSSNAQRDHMRHDWHLYNMKRRIAQLPPVAQETFNEKVLAAKATSSAAAAKAAFEKTCDACQKAFYSENSYQTHLHSKKHRDREARRARDQADDASSVMSSNFSLGEPINKPATVKQVTEGIQNTTIEEKENEAEDEEMVDEGEFSPRRCLFCSHTSSDMEQNTEHMLKQHGMFIPERDFLVDHTGLLHYLWRKINENHECLYCHGVRNNAAGARGHMRDKGHCMIAFETEPELIEIGQFYDFRSTYSDDEEEESVTSETMEDGGVAVDGDGADDGWETETSASSMDDDDEGVPKGQLYATEYELHLPSGRTAGHRSLARYYRQNLHNYGTGEEQRRTTPANGDNSGNRATTSRANGGSGMVGATDAQKRHAVTSERKDRTRAQRQEQRYTARVNRAANHQKHFRDPLLQ